MFSKKQTTDFSKFNTLIGKSTSFEGMLTAEGTIRIDGTVKGDIKVEGDIFIGESSHIVGNITCANIVVGGNIAGNIIAHNQLRIGATGKVVGDISVKSLIIDENGLFEGNSKMQQIEATNSKSSQKANN